jgi:uncharacterized protein (DUF983 family)
MKSSKPTSSLILSVINEKCPNCGRSPVFEKNTKLLRMPVMKEKCASCNYSFDREPGYFLGAMYVSYGIAVLFCLLTFLLFHFVFKGLPLIWTPVAMTVVMFLIAKKNYKLSRIIYIHIFPW